MYYVEIKKKSCNTYLELLDDIYYINRNIFSCINIYSKLFLDSYKYNEAYSLKHIIKIYKY